MNLMLLAGVFIFALALAFSGFPVSGFGGPISAMLVFGVIIAVTVHWLRKVAQDPIGSLLKIAACAIAFFIGVGIPISLMKLNYDLGAWGILVWAISWILAFKVGTLIAGIRDDEQ